MFDELLDGMGGLASAAAWPMFVGMGASAWPVLAPTLRSLLRTELA